MCAVFSAVVQDRPQMSADSRASGCGGGKGRCRAEGRLGCCASAGQRGARARGAGLAGGAARERGAQPGAATSEASHRRCRCSVPTLLGGPGAPSPSVALALPWWPCWALHLPLAPLAVRPRHPRHTRQ